MTSFFREQLLIDKTRSVLETIQLLVKNVFSLLGQILYKLAFFHITHKKKKGRNATVTSLKTCGAI